MVAGVFCEWLKVLLIALQAADFIDGLLDSFWSIFGSLDEVVALAKDDAAELHKLYHRNDLGHLAQDKAVKRRVEFRDKAYSYAGIQVWRDIEIAISLRCDLSTPGGLGQRQDQLGCIRRRIK